MVGSAKARGRAVLDFAPATDCIGRPRAESAPMPEGKVRSRTAPLAARACLRHARRTHRCARTERRAGALDIGITAFTTAKAAVHRCCDRGRQNIGLEFGRGCAWRQMREAAAADVSTLCAPRTVTARRR